MMCHNLRLLGAATLFLCSVVASAGPGLIQYQGRLTDAAGNPITTSVSVTFTFWSAATGGTQLGGTYQDTDGVTPNSQGLYTTMIGDEPGTKIPDAIFASSQVWLEVKIGSETLSPRKQIVATGYAFQSNWATTATTALASKDTLAAVAGRGASTATQLTLSGGAKIGKISPLTSGGSVQVENVYMVGGGIKLPNISAPASPAGMIYQVGDALYYGGAPVMLKQGSAYLIVQTTADPVANGASLQAAYTTAKSLKPHGADLATSNRLTILIPPGRYDITASQLVLDGEFIDLVGLSTAPTDQFVFGVNNAFHGTLVRQTANDLRIENLRVECSATNYQSYPPSAYRPDSCTTYTVMRNCEFAGTGQAISMGIHANFEGRYENVTAGDYAFGYMGDATGTFIKCKAGKYSFGCYNRTSGTFVDCAAGDNAFGFQGVVNGTFTRCTAGNYSFGYKTDASGTFTDCVGGGFCFGANGTASGTFDRCSASKTGFGYSGTASGRFNRCTAGVQGFGYKGTASGTFTACTGGGYCFGSSGTASGTFNQCVAGDNSFGSFGTAGGKFLNCTGGTFCFGFAGTASGVFTGCTADSYSFGTGDYSVAATASGTFTNCVGGGCCFGAGGGGSTLSTLSGTLINCTGGGHSFGGQYSINSSARLKNCAMTGDTWWGTWGGRMEGCRWETGLNCSATARIYNSTVLGTLDLASTAAGVTQSRARSITNDGNNVFGATNGAAMNIESAGIQ